MANDLGMGVSARWWLIAVLAGCGGGDVVLGDGRDASGSERDAGELRDSGNPRDAGARDTGSPPIDAATVPIDGL